MKRFFLNLIITSLLLLLVTTAMLWVANQWWTIKWARYSRPYDGAALHSVEAWSKAGRIIFARNVWGRGGNKNVRYKFEVFKNTSTSSSGYDVNELWAGFGWLSENTPPDMVDSSWQVISIPLWFSTTISAMALWLVWRKTLPKINPQNAFPMEAQSSKAK